jgi:hypothetical protein
MPAKICVQPGSFNNYRKGDLVWITFINAGTDTALVLGKIYKNPTEELANTRGSLSLNSLKVADVSGEAHGKVELPANTNFNIPDEEHNTLSKIINKIKNLEDQNKLLLNYIDDLLSQIKILNSAVGNDVVRDVDGEIIADSDNEVLHYHAAEDQV